MVDYCWVGFKWTIVLAVVAGAAAGLALYRQMDEQIRRHFESKIAAHYPGLNVSIRSAELVEGKGIRVHDLSIVEPSAEGPHAELLHIEEVVVECPTEWKQLLQEDPPVHRVLIRRPTLRATRRPDDTWSVGRLLPPPKFGNQPPDVVVENGVVEVFDPLKTPTSTLTLRDVNLSLVPESRAVGPATLPTPGRSEPAAHSLAAQDKSSSATPAKDTSTVRRLKGMVAGDGFRRVEIDGWVDLETPAFSIRGQAEAIEASPELRDSLPTPLAAKLPDLNVRGQSDLRFEVHYDPTAATPLKYDVQGRLARGRIDDGRLPHAWTDIRATVHINNSGYTIDDLAARSGQGTVHLACRASGFEPNSPVWLKAEVRQLDLDRALLNILPRSLQEQWYNYRPSGEVDADVLLTFDGKQWKPEMSVRCLNVSLTHHRFPYRLDHGKGLLELKADQLRLNLTAYSGSQPVRLSAEMSQPFGEPTGWFEAKGDDIQLDESLLSAIPHQASTVVRSLDPRGAINFYARMWRDKANEPMHKHLQIAVNHCSIRYKNFPYPLSDIRRGTLEMFDDNWTFRNLEGCNDQARITCEGHLTPGLQGNELVLKLTGRDVALKDDLRDALSPHIQQVWRDIRPRGVVDLSAEIRYLSESNKFSVSVNAQPQPQSTSIEPVHFPYRLDRLEGTLLYRDGQVTFERCRSMHGAVKISSEGFSTFQSDGRWNIQFTQLSVDRLRADRDLIQALPESLRKVLAELNPTGSINLQGSLGFERTGRSDEPLHATWNVRLGLQQSNLQLGGIGVENVHGQVALLGGFDGKRLQSRGELAVDALNYREFQLTQVMGPIWIDDGRVLFGSWVDHRENGTTDTARTGQARPPRPLTADYCGGKCQVDGWVTLGPEPRYVVNATLTEADLARCAQEVGAAKNNLRGRILATADLIGSGRTRNTLSGKGFIRLSEANVYELPVMISLLKILSIRTPDQNAFSAATIDYRIEGEHVYFDRIDFHGDAISLRGKGQMNFQSQIGLTFYATVGRGELDLPVIKQVFSGASQQIMLIHVDGTLQNPETRREAPARRQPCAAGHSPERGRRSSGEGRGESKDRGKPITV